MCSGNDQGESERWMMPPASSWRNSASAWRSLSGSMWPWGTQGGPSSWWCGESCVSATVFLFRRWRWLGTKPTGTVPSALWSRGRRRIWNAFPQRWFLLWRAVSETSSPAPGGRLNRPAAHGRTRNLTRVWACRRRRAKRWRKMCAAWTLGGGGCTPAGNFLPIGAGEQRAGRRCLWTVR